MALKFTQQVYSKPGGYEVIANQPFDNRLIVNSISDLCLATFTHETGSIIYYEGMVVSVLENNSLYMLADTSKMLSSSRPGEESGWVKLNVPELGISDEGKLLTVVRVNVGTTESPVYKCEAQWAEAPNGLPTMNENSVGKLLKVVKYELPPAVPGGESTYGYTAVWADAPTELPEITDTDKGKALFVDKTTGEVVWETIEHPTELPTIGPGSAGKVLTVSSNGVDTEWNTVDTSLMTTIHTEVLLELAQANSLKPGMKYRIIDYNPVANSGYQISINGTQYTIDTIKNDEINFDIIATASSASTLFDDVELVSRGDSSIFDYSKYEAKYDLFGNVSDSGVKYEYYKPNGYGVIYYMKDQFGNEASYDFENIYYINSTENMPMFTFTHAVLGLDYRQQGNIHNVRIKHSANDLPGIIFSLPKNTAKIDDVEIYNCKNIFIKNINLCHTKISNSSNIKTDIPFILQTHNYCPTFENLTICNNEGLTIGCGPGFVDQFEEYGGFYINNVNILPSSDTRSIDLEELHFDMKNILAQGLKDSDIANIFKLTPETGGWTLNIMLDTNTNTTTQLVNILLCGNRKYILDNPALNSWFAGEFDITMYKTIVNASKNVKPFDIFNPTYSNGSMRLFSLEIPQFHTTATSVVELGI